jgi:catechol 2,3-dioxygenase-like lactoylglutathione lyase family enzyme
MIEPKGVVHFSIAVSDLALSRKFYTEILGLKLVHDGSTIGRQFYIRDPDGNLIEFWDGTSILD